MKEYECPAVLDNLRPVLAVAAEELIASGTETSLRQRFFVVLEELFNNVAKESTVCMRRSFEWLPCRYCCHRCFSAST